MHDKFKEGEDEATAITIQGEEAWIKLRQNSNQPLNELDKLYLDLSGHIVEFTREAKRLEEMENEKCDIANANLACAMETTKKRYDAALVVANAVAVEEGRAKTQRAGEKSPPS